ncbi:glutathione hydrolase 5 proenzyme-like [Salmo salar]|uniref:Glutathione hydrolase n=1 Tax=Salmo salar TaxID=8030 RepID=A0A1S3LSD9_SALSA|nr:glutathione hydrolase 5 proenzyme-like [Salmo salar]|eukprot:XP_013993862.1 PREDICTED: gamma-glutamyltransferase 5-like [Salmo salar]
MSKYKPWQVGCCLCIGLFGSIISICLCILAFGVFINRGCSEDTYKHAAVSADSKLCSDIGRDILQQGGSAVDGAIAALLCTSLVNPQSMGLGGGSIFTVRDETGTVKTFSSRETVPQSFKADLLKGCPTSVTFITGSQWIGVPGELRGYEVVHRMYGKLPWAKLFEPTIRLAREGFPLPPFLGYLLNITLIGNLVKATSLCEVFCHKNKKVLGIGDTLKFPKLAETMETIAEQGVDAFYTGQIGLDLIEDVKAAGGTLTMEDLKSFRVRSEDAWTVPLGDYQMHIPPPPAGGAMLAFILNLVKGFHFTPRSMEGDQKVLTYHCYIEAAKFANGQRRNVHDPVFNTKQDASYMVNSDFADRIRQLISEDRTYNDSYYNITPSPDRFGTTHVSVLAEDGSAVSVTSTINQIFGAGIYSSRTGIILNNELADFCFRAERLSAGEQPPSSMAPAILSSSSGKKTLVIGGSGGSMITTAMALSIMNHLWLGMSLKDAIAAPVVFVDGNNNVKFEHGFDKSVIEALKVIGHRVTDYPYFFNVVNAVAKEDGCIKAVSDARKQGKSAGY